MVIRVFFFTALQCCLNAEPPFTQLFHFFRLFYIIKSPQTMLVGWILLLLIKIKYKALERLLQSLRRFWHSFPFCIFISEFRIALLVEGNTFKREEKKGETLTSIQSELARKSQDRQSPGVSYAILGQQAMCWAVKMASHLCSSKGQASPQPSFKPLFSSSRNLLPSRAQG